MRSEKESAIGHGSIMRPKQRARSRIFQRVVTTGLTLCLSLRVDFQNSTPKYRTAYPRAIGYEGGDVRSGKLLPLPSVALRTGTSELRVQSHCVMAAALAAKPALSVLNHREKFVSGPAMGTPDGTLTALGHHLAPEWVSKTG